MIAQVQSSVSLSMRKRGILSMDFRELMTNTIPYPRIHFLYPSMIGFKGDNRISYSDRPYGLTKKLIDPSSQLLNMHKL